MTLSDWLIVVSLLCLLYAVGTWAWGNWGPKPAPESVKKKPRKIAFTKRSARSNVQNAVNAGSGQQDAPATAVNVQSVQDSSTPPAAPAGDAGAAGDGFTLTARELAQLGEALQLRRDGATVEQAVCQGFGVTKGGSEGYKRAKALFDAATVTPGAAPAGTYAPTAPVRRRRTPARRTA